MSNSYNLPTDLSTVLANIATVDAVVDTIITRQRGQWLSAYLDLADVTWTDVINVSGSGILYCVIMATQNGADPINGVLIIDGITSNQLQTANVSGSPDFWQIGLDTLVEATRWQLTQTETILGFEFKTSLRIQIQCTDALVHAYTRVYYSLRS